MKKKPSSKSSRGSAKGEAVQLRLEPDLEQEIDAIARVLGLPKVEIIRRCARIGARLIIEDGYKLPPINPPNTNQPITASIPNSIPDIKRKAAS